MAPESKHQKGFSLNLEKKAFFTKQKENLKGFFGMPPIHLSNKPKQFYRFIWFKRNFFYFQPKAGGPMLIFSLFSPPPPFRFFGGGLFV